MTTLAFALASVSPATAADLAEIQRLYRTGSYAEAAKAAAEAIDAGAFDDGLSLIRIRAELAAGEYATALQTTDRALERYGTNLALRLAAREVYLRNNQPEQAAAQLVAIQNFVRQYPWRYSDAQSIVTLGRAALLTGAEPREVLDLLYDKAARERPDLVEPLQAIAELALDKGDDALAATNLTKALKLDDADPELYYLLAKAHASGSAEKSTAALIKALELNPRHVPSLLIEVDDALDAEDHTRAGQLLDRILDVNPREPSAWAYRAAIAHLAGDRKAEEAHRAKALESFGTNPEVDHLIGRRLARAYRFAEAAEYQRRALTLAPNFTPARVQLSQDLLRLGDEAEGWRLASEAYDRDGYNVLAHNLTILHDAIAKFRTLEADGFIVRMEAREAAIYGRRVLDLLHRARDVLCAKYEVELKEPVIVEIFPEQKDFAIRTFGLPGGAGFLGVCFGRVITANSPASQGDNPANWEATLWHEFCHVVTLTKTKNKMPRWLSEGISVYEERLADPTWGQALNPTFREMLLDEHLTPVSKLSGAFLKPRSPQHLTFAYFESSLVVEYLIERYGPPALKRILDDLANDVPINQALARHTEKIEQLDADFAKFARGKAAAFAQEADFAKLDLPKDIATADLASWNHEHPRSYAGLRLLAGRLLSAKQWEQAKPVLAELEKIHPPAALPLLAKVHRALDETSAERAVLEKLATIENDVTEAYVRLMELAAAAEDWPTVATNARRMLAVNPLAPATYRHLAAASEKLKRADEAIRAHEVLLIVDPSDPAEAHFRLAQLLVEQKQPAAARRHVLQALEEAPRYRAAQQLLLKIVADAAKVRKPTRAQPEPTT